MAENDGEIIKKYAMENAISYGKAQSKSVVGHVLKELPELKKDMKKTMKEVEAIVAEVNKMGKEKLEKEFANSGFEKKKENKKGVLANLPNVKGKIVMRFAPNPSGPLHIGHARTAILNDEYVKKYGGKLYLRIEDTDPKRVDKGAYHMIEEDLKWLGVEIDDTITQSRRLAVYRDFAVRLIKQGNAYVCSCGQKEFKKLKDKGKECPCRGNSLKENAGLWNKMLEGDTSLVLNLKTDIKHKNPALRDFPIMRVIEQYHPHTGRSWDLYPLMNFSVVIDDHLLGMTHVLRGKDHIVNTERQLFIYDYLGWNPPEFIHNGLLNVTGVNLSTSAMKEGIEAGKYKGWADPKLGTLRSLKRRGFDPEAIRNVMKAIGIGDANVTFDWSTLYAENKKLVESKANRYFFVPDPEEGWVKGVPEEADVIRIPLHPDFSKRGHRDLLLNKHDDTIKVFVAKKDAKKLKRGQTIRLKNFCNVQVDEVRPLMFRYLEEKDTSVPIIQWLPENVIGCEVIGPDKKTAGFCEEDCRHLDHGDIIQFERFGFCRVHEVEGNNLLAYFAHA
jgi:glutamyl-tRNA synthetase